jgi:hypothetical protein
MHANHRVVVTQRGGPEVLAMVQDAMPEPGRSRRGWRCGRPGVGVRPDVPSLRTVARDPEGSVSLTIGSMSGQTQSQ